MTHANLHSHHGGWKPWLIFGYLIFSVIPLGIGLSGYLHADFKEYKLKILGGWDGVYLSLLLALPVCAALVCILALLIKSNKDGDTDQFLKFCLFSMSLTPFFYLLLWSLYVHNVWADWANGLSVLAFVLTMLLVCLLIYTTYLIMWTRESPSPYLNVSDVKANSWGHFFLTLKKHMDEAEGGQPDSLSLLHRFENEYLRRAVRNGKSSRNREEVIAELNRLLSDPELYKATDLNQFATEERDSLHTEYDWQVYNRTLFDEAYAASLKKKGRFGEMQSALRKKGANWQERLKAGVAKSAFWAMIFFFTVFLGIMYLLALAFAFHDKATLRAEGKPAMFAPRSPLYNVGEYQHSATDVAQVAQTSPDGAEQQQKAEAAGWPEYVFYFDDYSAMPVYKDAPFDQAEFDGWAKSKREHDQAVKDLREQRNLSRDARSRLRAKLLSKEKEKEMDEAMAKATAKWKHWKNSLSLDRLVEAVINEDSAQHGQGLLIQVRGSASDPQVNDQDEARQNYPDNYSLSEARAQAVRYALLKRLAEKGRLHGGLQWVLLPLSNEVPTPEDSGRTQADPVAEVEGEIETSKLGDRTSLTGRLSQLKRGRDEKQLDEEAVKELAAKLRLYLNLLRGKEGQTTEEQDALEVKKRHTGQDFDETIKNLTHRYVDGDARKRIAVVSVMPAQQSAGSLFTPLGLMDYMYVTITGYDNIIPTTTYAKFLSLSASILQIFFFVVFFNSLLSMKMNREAPAAEDAEHPSARRNGVDSRPVNNPQGIQLNGDVDMSEVKKTLDEVKTLLQQHRGWRKFLPF